MNETILERRHKFISTLIVSTGALLGFEALSYIVGLYQIKTYLLVSFYVYFFHVFWLTFLFDLHLRKRGVLAFARLNAKGMAMVWAALKERIAHVLDWSYLRHFQNFLVLPGIIYWAVVVLLFLNPFREALKQVIVIIASISMTVAYWYFKDFFSRKMEAHEFGLRILSLVKLSAAFLVFSASLGATWYFGLGEEFLSLALLATSFLLIYQALFQHKLLHFQLYLWIILFSFVVAVVGIAVFRVWETNYFTGGLVILAVYNFFWGLTHHYLDGNLNKKVFWEYSLMTFLVLSFLLASHDFASRIN